MFLVRFLFFVGLLSFPSFALAWGYGHDVVADLLCANLPGEMKAFFVPEDLAVIRKHCHYPDLPNKNLEQIGEIVGSEDLALLKEYGYSGSDWLHRHVGRAATYVLLRKAFREKNSKNAAFYLSVLSHSISDQGAINHTPILQFTTYSRLEGVNYGIRNSCELGSQATLRQKIDSKLKDFQPEKLGNSFRESVYAVVLDCYFQAELSAELELIIAFGEPDVSEDGMAQITAAQMKSLLAIAYSAWQYAQSDEEFTHEMCAEIFSREEVRRREGRPETQAVYAGLFDENLNPKNPKATIGIVCEPFGSFHIWALSYVGKLLTASSGRTLRENGYAVRALSFWEMETKPLPDPKEVPVVLIFTGHSNLSAEITKALQDYQKRGGKFLCVGGRDSANLSGMTRFFEKCADDEVPVSSKWGIQNEDVFRAMRFTFAPEMKRLGTDPYALRRNPNFEGFCKPCCQFRIREDASLTPLAWLTSPKGKVCVAAVSSEAAWLPEYLLLPFLFSDVKTLNWTDLHLDPFAEKVLLDALERLCENQKAKP